ncbi:MAG: MvdC family ATP-grasp ribosomal peptide maturase [Flammeovirgaceae bacterium]
MKVLLLTHSGDYFTIDRVQDALTNLGLHPIRVNTDLFPQELKLIVSIDEHGLKATLETASEVVSLDDVAAVWLRRIWHPKIDEDIEEVFREICIKESQTVIKDLLNLLDHAFWFDRLATVQQGNNKMLQLKLAVQSGLKIPTTRITNDTETAISFYHNQSSIITKMNAQTSYGMGRSSMSMHTYRVEEEHLEELDSLQYCPMVFQQEIAKAQELRVIYVAGKFFVGAIDASGSEEGQVDWRMVKIGETRWKKAHLPIHIQQQLTLFMNKLNLQFGAIDLIQTPDQEYIFLEVNPVGEWGMLENELDLPISKAIAQAIYDNIQQD